MPPKKTTETQPEAPVVTTPDVVSQAVTDSLGITNKRFTVNKSVVVGRTDLKDLVDIRQATEIRQVAQPILELKEAEVLGHQSWREWPHIEGHYCTSVNGRRFIVSGKTMEKLVEKGLVL